MYMQDGKPIQVPYGRRNVNVTRLEFQDALAVLLARVEALEAKQVEATEYTDTKEPEVIVTEDKPKRGRPAKEATE